ncbi:acetyltransferase [Paenibacillus sp. S-38]|uniref:acetyltransferase n=1 Tax=Paenibacillus sp. S-38 TaxID=3416710 RepID=UPI003CE9D526
MQRLNSGTAVKVEEAEIRAVASRLQAIREQEGNPHGVYIRRFGRVHAFLVKAIPDFNSVRGLGLEEGDEDLVDEILDFYAEHEAACRFDIVPFGAAPALLTRLAERGYGQSGFHTSLCGFVPQLGLSADPRSGRLAVRRLREDEFGLYAEIYTASFGMPAFLQPAVAENNRVLYGRSGWRFYLALYDDQPAAVGVLHAEQGTGSLAAAATLPGFRRLGCQSALLLARLEEAVRQECGLLVGQAAFGSPSQANMERIGMKVAYTKALWRRLETAKG